MDKHLKNELKDLHENLDNLGQERRLLVDKICNIQLAIDEIEFGVKRSQEIEYEGKKGIVERFSTFWVIMRKYKKEGTLSKYTTVCYKWGRKNA